MSSAELFVIACEYVSGFECVCVHRYYNIPYLLFLLNLNLKFNSRQSQIGTRPLPKCHQQFITSCPTGLFKKKNIQTKRRKKKKRQITFSRCLFWYSAHIHDWYQFIPITIDGSLRWWTTRFNSRDVLYILNSYISRRSI